MENWVKINGFENYEISSEGRVRSLSFKRTGICKIINPCKSKKQYLVIRLYKNGLPNCKKIHQLVAIHFLNHLPCGMNKIIDHINGVKTDNRLVNLRITDNRTNCSKGRKNKTSSFTGVCFDASKQKYKAAIYYDGKHHFLGSFKNEIDAKNSYDNALKNITNN
jgi:hypothetical protein